MIFTYLILEETAATSGTWGHVPPIGEAQAPDMKCGNLLFTLIQRMMEHGQLLLIFQPLVMR